MRILLIGKGGQVGFELRRALAPLGEVVAVDYPDVDLADPASIRRTVEEARPEVVVNAAAYTAVDKAKTEPERAAYEEDDRTSPVSVYGATKRDGEDALAASGAEYLTFRTSWVFGAVGQNFVKTILRLAAERESLDVVADQVGAPTPASLLADVTAQVLGRLVSRPPGEIPSGLYHLVAAGETSWHGFARAIVRGALARGRALRLSPEAIRPIATAAYPLPAQRPANSRLDTNRLRRTFGLVLPPWESGLDHVLDQIA